MSHQYGRRRTTPPPACTKILSDGHGVGATTARVTDDGAGAVGGGMGTIARADPVGPSEESGEARHDPIPIPTAKVAASVPATGMSQRLGGTQWATDSRVTL
jgi:hypothetical protein